jgi:hypothetical protein
MKKIAILFAIVALVPLKLHALPNDSTELVIDENNIEQGYVPSEKGPNRKIYRQFFLELGFMADNSNQGANTRFFYTNEKALGFRVKRRFNNYLASTLELGYRTPVFNLKQESSKMVPDNFQHDEEKIDVHTITTALHLRLNLDKRRGNYLGTFIEGGGYFGYVLTSRHLTWDKPDGSSARVTKVVEKGLHYVNKYDYGLSAKLGHNHWSLYARYRLSDMFKKYNGIKYQELSKLTIGVDLGL